MILDERTELCDATALNTGGAGTYNIGDQIDTQGQVRTNLTRDLGTSSDLYLVARMVTNATSGGSATLTLRLVSDDTATPNTSTASIHVVSPTFAVAALTAGTTIMVQKLPAGQYERYVGVQQITGTAAFTGGTVDVFLTDDPSLWTAYADAL
jgi:hypothetical protein